MDKVDKATRSRIMASVRSVGNRSTERRLRAYLVQRGVGGWRVRPKGITGKPDFAFPSLRIAVFVDGCFWHGCPVCGRPPHSNVEYWGPKVAMNRTRDEAVTSDLQKTGWKVLRIWEHEIRQTPSLIVGRIQALRAGQSAAITVQGLVR